MLKRQQNEIKAGIGFGLASGVIATLGMIIGLNSAIKEKLPIIGAIIMIAVADALSDALGMYISEEYQSKHTKKEILESTFTTLLSKFSFAIIFVFPFIFLNLSSAVAASLALGFVILTIFSAVIARQEKQGIGKVVFHHLFIATFVISVSQILGVFISLFFS